MRHRASVGIVVPHPPRSHAPCNGLKRFTVRDGFHLKERNDERRDEIDHAIAGSGIGHGSTSAGSPNQASNVVQASNYPVDHRASCVDVEVAMIFDFLHRPAPLVTSNQAAEMPKTPLGHTPIAAIQPNDLNIDNDALLHPAHQLAEAEAIVSRLGSSANWLIYRHRSNETPRRKDQQLEQMITEVLSAKDDQLVCPIPPKDVTKRSRRAHRKQRRLAPTTTTKYTHQHLSAVSNAGAASSGIIKVSSPTISAFSTQRSRLRQKAAVPLKTERLLGRMHELRSFPAVVDRVLENAREKRLEMVEQHGENHIVKNKNRHRLIPPLQRPVHTPVFPSIVDHKQQQAWLRKQLVEETHELTLKSVVNRWQNRRMQIQQQERTYYVQSQWLLITCLGQATGKWIKQFREYRARRALIFRLAMIKKIQRYWKQRQFLRQNKQAVLAMPADSPLRSQFFRMPSVLKAICIVQKGMRGWLSRKRRRENQRAIEIIITSWLEFQDVKFRRLILRFRKRVREFQTRWRNWRAITDARIKLLLLVWSKVERKHKRRGGLVTTVDEESRQSESLSPVKNHPRSTTRELIHRHLRNGGIVLTAVSALGGSISNDNKSTSPSKWSNPERALRQNVEEDLHLAMRDFYSTKNPSSTNVRTSTSPVHHQSTSVHPRGANHESQSIPKNSSASVIQPWRNASNHTDEKIPHSLKVSLLRQLLSEKRKAFQATKDRKRVEWRKKRQQLRQVDFRYNVLDELAAYQRFQAEHAVFLVLRSISENEILHLIERAHQQLRVSTNSHSLSALPLPMEMPIALSSPKKSLTPIAPSTAPRSSRYDGPRKSTMTINPIHSSIVRGLTVKELSITTRADPLSHL